MAKKIIFALIAVIAVSAALEIAARFLESSLEKRAAFNPESGWQASFFKSFLDWHESDPDLLWRFKAGLDNPLITTNSDHLIGPEIPETKKPDDIRILLLGDSSPVGLGLKSRQQAFGEVLSYLLQLEFHGNRDIQLINAAVSGYTSEQVARFLEMRGWAFKPDLVLLYCGNNDASISGPLSDKQLLEGQKLQSVRKVLSHLALYRVIRTLLASDRQADSTNQKNPIVRVTPERYKYNLEKIADACAKHDVPLVVIKPPVPLLWPAGLQFKSLAHITGESGELIFPRMLREILGREIRYCFETMKLNEIYGEGDVFTRQVLDAAYHASLNTREAIEYYRRLSESEPYSAVVKNNLGVSYWYDGNGKLATEYLKEGRNLYCQISFDSTQYAEIAAGSPFLYNIGISLLDNETFLYPEREPSSEGTIYLDSALQADFLSLRIKRSYLRAIDDIGKKEKVTVVDIPEVFNRKGNEFLFIDHCHPTAEGHILIARAILAAINKNGLLQ